MAHTRAGDDFQAISAHIEELHREREAERHPGEGMTCWPVPESTANMNTKRLGLSDAEEDALVSFMQTLTDGFMSRDQR